MMFLTRGVVADVSLICIIPSSCSPQFLNGTSGIPILRSHTRSHELYTGGGVRLVFMQLFLKQWHPLGAKSEKTHTVELPVWHLASS